MTRVILASTRHADNSPNAVPIVSFVNPAGRKNLGENEIKACRQPEIGIYSVSSMKQKQAARSFG
jgi:hypothetical protein